MPLYEYACEDCEIVQERLERYDDPVVPVPCICGGIATRIISPPAKYPAEITPYYDHGLGQRIDSRQQRRAEMARLGIEETGTSHRHGTTGTIYSQPGAPAVSVPKSGAYATPRP